MTTSGASTPLHSSPVDKILLLGRPCGNTSTAATVLQDAGITPAAIILADPASAPAQEPEEGGRCSVYRAASPLATRRLLERLQPDLVIAACYPWRLSGRARAAARCGVLNIHPSPLPYGRGPDPAFWVYRQGEREAGVTVHLMDDGLDSGPILAQRRIIVPDDMDAVSLERHLFEIGARITAGQVPRVLAGEAPFSQQDELFATYQPAPGPLDWLISPLLPAAWAWRFARGVAPLHGPLRVQVQGKFVPVHNAIAWGDHGSPPTGQPASTVSIQFRPGWVVFET